MHDTMMINWIFLLWKLRQKSIPVCCRDSCEGKCYRIKYLWFMLISIIRTQCVSDTVFVLLPATLLDVNKILDQENAEKWRYHIDIMLRRFNMKSLLWCYIPAISKLALLLQWGKLIATMISSCKKKPIKPKLILWTLPEPCILAILAVRNHQSSSIFTLPYLYSIDWLNSLEVSPCHGPYREGLMVWVTNAEG